MTEAQIKYMVDRFLGWKLPESFSPDAGISFKRTFNENTAHPMKHEPSGTNLFDAIQADAMVRYLVEGMPTDALNAVFLKQRYGAVVATIHETPDGLLEVQKVNDGSFILTVHSRVGETDRFEDISIKLEPKHFAMLGSIASMT